MSSLDPEQIALSGADEQTDLGLHCLPKYVCPKLWIIMQTKGMQADVRPLNMYNPYLKRQLIVSTNRDGILCNHKKHYLYFAIMMIKVRLYIDNPN